MESIETLPPGSPYVGHVKNGVVVLDTPVSLPEGQAVRIEPLEQATTSAVHEERANRLQRMQTIFAQWDDEDSKLSDEEADQLHITLLQNRGLSFRSPEQY